MQGFQYLLNALGARNLKILNNYLTFFQDCLSYNRKILLPIKIGCVLVNSSMAVIT